MRFIATLFILALSFSLQAAVDLVTLPKREKTQLTIYNSEDITMVREQRILTVKKGINRIQFSWANTLIDPTSIDFRILDQLDKVDLVDTTFPSGRNDALQWNIQSEINGKIAVEIRYFTSGITWQADYVGIANAREDDIKLKGYVRIYNNSGEEYDNAETRLVVGTINLVENIADLATRPAPTKYREKSKGRRAEMRKLFSKRVSHAEVEEVADFDDMVMEGDAEEKEAPNIVKEGLSEYFIFTIEGREDIAINKPVRLISMDVQDIPLETVFKLSDRYNATIFKRYYRFKNKKLIDSFGSEKKLNPLHNLGVSPLPDGAVRLFSEYKNKDLAYRGGTQTKYIAIGDRFEVDLGRDKDITIKKRCIEQKKINIKVRQYKRRLSNTWVEYYDRVDYDEVFTYEEEMVSGKDTLSKVELERYFGNNVIMWSQGNEPKGWDSNKAGVYVDMRTIPGKVEKVDQHYIKYYLDLKPGQLQKIRYTVTHKHRVTGRKLNVQKIREPK
jgi:hypothetical protein